MKVLSYIVPSLGARLANRSLKPDSIVESLTPDEWLAALIEWPNLVAASEALFNTDLSRIQRLEDKLRSWQQYVTLLIPFAAGLVGAAIGKKLLWPSLAGVLAAGHLLAALLVSMAGTGGRRIYYPTTMDINEAANTDVDPSLSLAVARLRSLELNAPVSLQLNNHIWAAGLSLVWAVGLLLVGLVLLLPVLL